VEQNQHTTPELEFRRFLESLDGRFPDEFVAGLRARMAGGHRAEVAHAVAFAAIAEATALTDTEIDLLIATLTRAGQETSMAQAIPRPRLAGVAPLMSHSA